VTETLPGKVAAFTVRRRDHYENREALSLGGNTDTKVPNS
jgi:hypothetical protein